MINPIEPGHIPGQNPNTPERLPGHTQIEFGSRFGGAIFFGVIVLAVVLVVSLIVSTGSQAADSSTRVSDVMQTIAYLGGAIVLGAVIAYGVNRSRNGAPNATQAAATKNLYREEERDRQRKEESAHRSSNPIDVIERKTDTTG